MNRLRIIIIGFLCLLAINVSAQELTPKFDEYMDAAVKQGRFSGDVLVARDGRILFNRGYGMANLEFDIPNTPHTKFRLGSITKPFTSMLTLQLVEQNKIKLDAKISDYLPDYRKDTGEKVTIHQLLTHTSGIPSYTGQPGFSEAARAFPEGNGGRPPLRPSHQIGRRAGAHRRGHRVGGTRSGRRTHRNIRRRS